MTRVFVADKLEAPGLDLLEQSGIELDLRSGLKGEELRAAIRAADGLIVRSGTTVTAAELEDPGKLRVIVRAGVGVDNIDVSAATRKGILVMNTPGGNTVSTAEQTVALMMGLAPPHARCRRQPARRQMGAQQVHRHAVGRQDPRRRGPGPHRPRGSPAVAAGLDMKVVGFDPFIPASAAGQLGIDTAPDLAALLPQCDFLTVHTPLSDETRGLVGAAQLALMPKGGAGGQLRAGRHHRRAGPGRRRRQRPSRRCRRGRVQPGAAPAGASAGGRAGHRGHAAPRGPPRWRPRCPWPRRLRA